MTRSVAITLFALALFLGVWDGLLNLGLSTVHAVLLGSVGRAGVWAVTGAALFGGAWAVLNEQEE